jgi:hypothetical protein
VCEDEEEEDDDDDQDDPDRDGVPARYPVEPEELLEP